MKLLIFSTKTCGPCRMMAPIIESVTKELGIQTQRLESSEEFLQYGVKRVPTLIIVDENDKEIKRQVGAMPKPTLKKWLS